MRKIFFFFLLASLSSNAQKKEKGTIEVVPIIGHSTFFYIDYNIPFYGSDSSDSVESVNFGVDGDYYFNDRWSLRSGLLYQTMGDKKMSPFNGVEKLNYLNIPVNANWHFGSTRKWNLNFGLTPGFLLSAKGDYNGTEDVNLKDSLNSFQLGFSFGIGYKIRVSDEFSILIDFRGFTGLTNIKKEQDVTNNGSSFNVGGVFHFK